MARAGRPAHLRGGGPDRPPCCTRSTSSRCVLAEFFIEYFAIDLIMDDDGAAAAWWR